MHALLLSIFHWIVCISGSKPVVVAHMLSCTVIIIIIINTCSGHKVFVLVSVQISA